MKRPAALLCVSCLVTVALFLAMHPPGARADPGVLYVAPGSNCGGAAPCFGDLQAAVDAAAPNDEIRVATGLYTQTTTRPRHDATSAGLVTQTVYISKTVVIRGGYSADFSTRDTEAYPTTLDAEGRGRGVYIVGDIQPTLDGLRITNGDATGLGGYEYSGTSDAGGGIYVMTATATLIDVRVYSNTARHGGGAFIAGSSGRVLDSVISDNHADTGGGGLFSYQGAVDVEASPHHLQHLRQHRRRRISVLQRRDA